LFRKLYYYINLKSLKTLRSLRCGLCNPRTEGKLAFNTRREKLVPELWGRGERCGRGLFETNFN